MSGDYDQEMLQDFIVEVMGNIEKIEEVCLAFEGGEQTREGINSLFRSFHTIKGLAGFVDQYLIQSIAHQTEEMLDAYRKEELTVTSKMVDIVFESADIIKKICSDFALAKDEETTARIDRHLKEIEAHSSTPTMPKLGELAIREQKAQVRDVVDALRRQKGNKASGVTTEDNKYIRVLAHKIDTLVDMLGELIVIGASVEQAAANQVGGDSTLVHNFGKMTRITKEMQNLALSMRMVSLRSTFLKLQRVARDASAQLNKSVSICVEGEDIEIDRGVAEKLLEPLLHLVKNSISHGIEDEAARVAVSKSAQGQISIRASSNRGFVNIEISDDGAGIDTSLVLKKALEKRIANPNYTYSEAEIIELLFVPGFSTNKAVDSISGRGVGLDVVRTEVKRLGGKVSVTTSLGEGSCFRLKIPINTAILNGTVVIIGDERYIVPTLFINRILNPSEDEWVHVHGQQSLVKMRDTLVPLIDVDFNLTSKHSAPRHSLVVVFEYEQEFRGLRVDKVVDRRDIVVKPLTDEIYSAQCFSGASILGDGKVSLILDVEALYKKGG